MRGSAVRRIYTVLAKLSLSAALLATTAPAAANNTVGAWSTLKPWPLIAVHAVLMPDGRLLTYGTTGTGQQTGKFIYDVWDSTAGLDAGHLTLPNTTRTDLFCSSQLVVPSGGQVFIAGGDNWTSHATATDTTSDIALTKSQRYTITMDYYDTTGTAVAKLYWKRPGQTTFIAVPVTRLYAN